MTRLRRAGWWMGSLLACTWAAGAHAQTCEQDSDCSKGFTCAEYVWELPCAAPECQDPEKCPDASTDCGTEVHHECTPADCELDTDCGEDMVCYKQTLTSCSGSTAAAVDCPPNEPCPEQTEPAAPPEEPMCTEEVIQQCTPRYVLPCEQDSDCGAGFTCQASEECSCSGSAGGAAPAEPQPVDAGVSDSGGGSDFAPAADGGIERPAPEDAGSSTTCECHESELKHCELKPMPCEADTDCPSSFLCKSHSSDSVAACDLPEGADASTCAPVEPEPDTQKYCEPPYKGQDHGGIAESGAMRSDTANSAPTAAQGASDAGVADPTEAEGDDNDEASSSAAADGCNVGSGTDGSSASWFGMLLIALGLRSRRRQR